MKHMLFYYNTYYAILQRPHLRPAQEDGGGLRNANLGVVAACYYYSYYYNYY